MNSPASDTAENLSNASREAAADFRRRSSRVKDTAAEEMQAFLSDVEDLVKRVANISDADIARVRPVVMTMCQRFTHMGPSGAGQIAKLCNQILVGCTMALVAEATKLAVNAGIDAAKLPECLRGGTADSPVLRTWLPRMLERQFEDRLAASAVVLKDLDTAHALGRATGTALPMTATAAELFRLLGAKGGAQWDPAALISLYD